MTSVYFIKINSKMWEELKCCAIYNLINTLCERV